MEKVVTQEVESFYYHYPTVATIVTSHAGGRDNAMAAAWHSAVSRQPPLYQVAISPKRFSYNLILESGEFAVNFVPYETAKLVAMVGGCSGRQVDKFQAFHIARVPSLKVRAPILEVAYAAYECQVIARYPTGDHDLFIGQVVAVHHAPAAFTSGKMVEANRVLPIVYLGDDRYGAPAPEKLVHLERAPLIAAALRPSGA